MLQAVNCQLRRSLVLSNIFTTSIRNISISAPRAVKDITEHRDGKTLTIDAVVKESGREHRLYKPEGRNGACPLCALGLDVKHTDVLILEQFMRPGGGLLPRRTTGLCSWQQRKMGFMVAMAIQAGLFPENNTSSARLDSKWFYRFRNYNSYYDENTIQFAKQYYRIQRNKQLAQAEKLALAELGEE